MTVRTSSESVVEVEVDPETAFRIFTDEIDLWWVRGPINHYDASRVAELRLEPGVGGRMLEIYDEAADDLLETARITVWEPGVRLVMRQSQQDTETDIRFEPTGSGTRVRVSQYLVPGGDTSGLGFGWVAMLGTYDAWTRRRESAPRTPREHGRLGIALYYRDPGAAARWLRDVFGLGSWDVDSAPAEGEPASWIEFHVGDALVVLFAREDDDAAGDRGVRPERPVAHNVWVHVDDLAAHFERARAAGATIVSPIERHGARSYLAEDLEGYRWRFLQARPTMR